MTAAHPGESLGQSVGILSQVSGRGGTLSDAEEGVVAAESSNVEIEEADLGNAEIGLTHGVELIEVEAGEVGAQFIEHCGADIAGPSHGANIVMRLKGDVFNRPPAAVDVVQVNDIGAHEDLVIAVRIVDAAVVLVAAAGVGNPEIEKA